MKHRSVLFFCLSHGGCTPAPIEPRGLRAPSSGTMFPINRQMKICDSTLHYWKRI